MNLSFSLCSCCKRAANFGHSQLVHITIESRVYGAVCNDCRKYISDKFEEMMNEIPIPEVLQPYLIQPDKMRCEECKRIKGHEDGCSQKNFLEG